jgi:nitronate monooxygenase
VIDPAIIQGGMGVGISSWRLARAVSQLGQLGVVSGTALDQLLVRRLQDGDPGGHMRRALDMFPVGRVAAAVRDRYFIPGGKAAGQSYRRVPMAALNGPPELQVLTVVANFAEVVLARDGHAQPVGINYLEKIQIPHLPSLYGAMLAGVGVVIMGAGIPTRIPGVLDRFARHEPVTYPLHVAGLEAGDEPPAVRFDPADVGVPRRTPLDRPSFVPIVSSHVLAKTLARKSNGRVDGFVIEGPTAGGHNAPPRGAPPLSSTGEPVYGERDRVDLAAIRELALPFWLAGGYGSAERLKEARAAGAAGIQVGTAFSLCAESGLHPTYRLALIRRALDGSARVFTDPFASPTGFPFKIAELDGTLSDPSVYARRPRICDLGYLREAFCSGGGVDFRCPSEPVSLYVSKGGDVEDTRNRKCMCNALIANVGHAQVRAGRYAEPPLITAGDDLVHIRRFIRPGRTDYTAADVVTTLLETPPA